MPVLEKKNNQTKIPTEQKFKKKNQLNQTAIIFLI